MYYTQKPWRAHDTLFWFTVLGLGVAAFTGLVAICVLAIGLTPWEIVTVRAEIPSPPIMASGALQVSLVDQLCLNDGDCTTIATSCNSCTCGDAINKIYEQKYSGQYAALCANVRPVVCDYACPTTARCSNKRCSLGAAGFSLNFSLGGSIFGNSYAITITPTGAVTYREQSNQSSTPGQRWERNLTAAELQQVQTVISGANLINLPAQDYQREPLAPDQAEYRLTVMLNGKENSIRCGVPLGYPSPFTACQQQIEKLRTILNQILGVNIH